MKLVTQMEPSSACSYVATQRGGVALLFEGHRYNKVRDGKDGTVYWRCSRDRQCPGRAVTVNNRVKKSNNKHNHPPEASLLMRNGSGGQHHPSPGHNSTNHHASLHSSSSNSTSSAMAAAAAAAAAYASFLQGSGHPGKSSQMPPSGLVASSVTSRPQPRTPPSTASSSSPSPLGFNSTGSNNFSSAFSFLQNLASSAASNSTEAGHLLNHGQLSNNNDNRRQALNLSNNNGTGGDLSANSRLPFSHLNNHFNLLNHRNQLEPLAKLTPNSPPPTPTSSNASNQFLFSKTFQNQYSKLLKNQFNSNSANSNNTLDLSSSLFSQYAQSPNHSHSSPSFNSQEKSEPSSPSHNAIAMNLAQQQQQMLEQAATLPNNLTAFMLQDVFQEAQAAAVAAAAFPSLISETFKYLIAAAATNPQMATTLANALSGHNPLFKNFDLTMATATAAAVAAASNNNSPNGDSGNTFSKLAPGSGDLTDRSPLAALRDLTGGPSLRVDLDNCFTREDQPLNMALKDKGNALKMLRALMRIGGVNPRFATDSVAEPFQALIVPTSDAHGSEYIAPCDARRAFLSSFTGSAGTAVVTMKEAALWTDGRYFLQADQQLDKQHWMLMKQNQPGTPTIGEWLNKVLQSGSVVGADPFTLSFEGWTKLEHELALYGNLLVQTPGNLVDEIWAQRPPRPAEAVIPLDLCFAGKSWSEKIAEIREEMSKKDASALVLTALDDIAWLLNLRGSDIEFNPIFFAYVVVTMDRTYLFIDESKLTPQALSHLQIANSHLNDGFSSPSARSSTSVSSATGNGQTFSPVDDIDMNTKSEIELQPYDMISSFIRAHLTKNHSGKIWISNKSSYALVILIPETRRLMTGVSPVTCRKAIKNSIEVEGMRRAHIKDAVALCEFFAWLEDEVLHRSKKGSSSPTSINSPESSPGFHLNLTIDELTVEIKLEEFRRQQENYIGPSFATIAGSGPNGAVIHYQSTEETNRPITTEEMFLLDSGAQFRDGTTDVTRTIHLGTPSNYEKECFTRVVKGHISLALARFPNLVKGQFLDSFARRALWDVGLDYNHGTGHGVGMFLNVHEPPSSISNRISLDDPGISENMILSNEPGYYEPNKFGIRIESLVLTKKIDLKYNFDNRGYLGFDTITLVPIQTKLLDPSLLTAEEIEWIDQYHQQCRDIVGEELQKQGRTRALQWLIKETEPLC